MPHTECYVNGVWYPSVSTIISAESKPWLQTWREKWGSLAERKVKAANEIGTEFHRCVEQYLETGGYQLSMTLSTAYYPRLRGMMGSFVDWATSVNGEIHSTELKVISHTHTYSGTLDAVGTFDGNPMLYDWKTSSRIYPDMDIQLVAYAEAYKEQTGQEIKQGMIVHVSKDKPHFKLTTKTFKLGKRVFNKFLKLRSMFDEIYDQSSASIQTLDFEE